MVAAAEKVLGVRDFRGSILPGRRPGVGSVRAKVVGRGDGFVGHSGRVAMSEIFSENWATLKTIAGENMLDVECRFLDYTHLHRGRHQAVRQPVAVLL